MPSKAEPLPPTTSAPALAAVALIAYQQPHPSGTVGLVAARLRSTHRRYASPPPSASGTRQRAGATTHIPNATGELPNCPLTTRDTGCPAPLFVGTPTDGVHRACANQRRTLKRTDSTAAHDVPPFSAESGKSRNSWLRHGFRLHKSPWMDFCAQKTEERSGCDAWMHRLFLLKAKKEEKHGFAMLFACIKVHGWMFVHKKQRSGMRAMHGCIAFFC